MAVQWQFEDFAFQYRESGLKLCCLPACSHGTSFFHVMLCQFGSFSPFPVDHLSFWWARDDSSSWSWEHAEGEINSVWVSQENPLREGGREGGSNCGTEESIDVYQVEIQRWKKGTSMTANCQYRALGIHPPQFQHQTKLHVLPIKGLHLAYSLFIKNHTSGFSGKSLS